MSVPKDGWKLGRDSFNVMVAWFVDGNVRTFYSMDWRHRFSKQRDERLGFQRYDGLVHKYGTRARTILISKNDSKIPRKRTLLFCYEYGNQREVTEELRQQIREEL